jgi:ADP-ribose pyrophosphatase YjhB (NUDIX family)
VECAHCGYALFVNPRPTGTVIILRDSSFLAVKRAREPQLGRWDLPGGFCDGWELPADAAVREAREELGVDVELTGFVGMYLGSYDFQAEKLPVLDCFWRARITAGDITLDPREATELAWFSVWNPPALAFTTMDRAIQDLRVCLGREAVGN